MNWLLVIIAFSVGFAGGFIVRGSAERHDDPS